ncbi:NisI/SpaI family lantibiotic immunity lipoprotein [Lactovum odontotermitis]
MKKKNFLVIIILAALTLLTGCVQKADEKVRFSADNYQSFVYKQTDYSITNNEIPENHITGALSKFHKTIIVDRDNQRLLSKSTENSTTLSLVNLFKTSDNLICIGINNKFFQVLPTNKVPAGKQLNIQSFSKTYGEHDFSINRKDVRQINFGNSTYRITNQTVPAEDLDDYLFLFTEDKLFNPENGKEIPKSEWKKIDWYGSESKEKRVEWNYGEIDSLKNYPLNQAFAVEINDKFVLAEKIENPK